ncbi:MAG: hypothetical protein LC642_00455, partial [Verrucomicrobiaceae bacterium]|nr:hypothetical protein [Verrucomicrobiaceae bacterium]
LVFACACSLNCISIAIWERNLDRAQQRISIATEFPAVARFLLPGCGLLVIFVLNARVSAVHFAVAVSAMLLALLHITRERTEPNVRTALADLVLLLPALALT